MKKKAVITLLGMLSHSKPIYISTDGEVNRVFQDIPKKDRAIYKFSEELNKFNSVLVKKQYINTLPMLIDIFEDREIIPIATQKAKNIQKKSLEFLNIDNRCLNNTVIIDESNYEVIFQQISELLQREEYENFIIDLTHGFRHLPILMMINLIIASIRDIDKIEHIFFAKEIVNGEEYEIIDLLEYIGLSKLSFVLENFNTNYTIGNKLIFKNEKYQEVADSLRIISGHILANSMKRLLDGDKSLIEETIEKLIQLQKDDKKVASFSSFLKKIIEHLEEIQSLKNEKDYIRLFKFSEIMKEREYLLNSITLLNESMGLYCAKKIADISSDTKRNIENYKNSSDFDFYKFSHKSKILVEKENNFTGTYLTRNINKSEIVSELQRQDNEELKSLITEIGNLRNNLAHGNSSDEIDNVKLTITSLIKRYKNYIK